MNIDVGALRELVQERGIDFESAAVAVEQALLAAYHKQEGAHLHARAELNRKTGIVTVWAKEILSKRENPVATLDEDKYIYELGEEFNDTPEDFGRVAAATARQVIQQKLRQAEDFQVLGDFKDKRHEIISGVVKPFEAVDERANRRPERNFSSANGSVKLDVGNGIEAFLPLHEQAATEDYTPGARFRVYVLDVHRGQNGPQITVSRSHPDLVKKLFALEVPEIEQGIVEIVSLAREVGHRTKIAIKSNDPAVNAKGAFIGPMGARARAVMNELGGEKIDIVDWDENPAHFIANALSPSKTVGVKIIDEEAKVAHVVVPDYQLSLAIGREGQNARLAARLTGWKIDITSDGKTTAPPEDSKATKKEPKQSTKSASSDVVADEK
jgi:N utilization substance protein A